MTIKDQMLKARALIIEKRYDEARRILEKIDHPTARDWLAKLDERAPEGGASPRARQGSQKRSARRSPLPLILAGLVVLVVVAAGVFFALPRINNPANPPAQPLSPPAADNAATEAASSAAAETSLPDESATQADASADSGAVADVAGSGLRVPFIVTNGMVTVELPAIWVCDCSGGRGQLHAEADVRGVVRADIAARAFDPAYYLDKTLNDALNEELDEGDTLTAQESLSSGSREVLAAAVTDEDGDVESRYYVKDSDGHVVRMVIPSYVDDHARLRPAVLLMLDTAEGETGDAALNLTTRLLESTIGYNAALNRWRAADNLDPGKDHYVALPANWVIGRGGFLGLPMAMRSDVETSTATALVSIPRSYFSSDDAVMDILISFSGGDPVGAQETLQAGGREVAFAVFSQADVPNSTSANYLTRDSDGDVVALVVQPDVVDQAALRDDLLFMIGNIEVENVDYLVKLRRIGVLPADETSSDGYEPVLPS